MGRGPSVLVVAESVGRAGGRAAETIVARGPGLVVGDEHEIADGACHPVGLAGPREVRWRSRADGAMSAEGCAEHLDGCAADESRTGLTNEDKGTRGDVGGHKGGLSTSGGPADETSLRHAMTDMGQFRCDAQHVARSGSVG